MENMKRVRRADFKLACFIQFLHTKHKFPPTNRYLKDGSSTNKRGGYRLITSSKLQKKK